MGKEGNQAASFSDYAVPEFRAIRRLVFWHGRNFGSNVSDYMCSCLFKSVAFSNMLWIYNLQAGYAGLMMLDDFYYASYNSIQTVYAMGYIMIWDQSLSFSDSAVNELGKSSNYELETAKLGWVQMPLYYKYNKEFNMKTLYYRCVAWVAYAFPTGFLCYYVPFYTYNYGVSSINGKTEDLWAPGLTALVCNVLIHHI